MYSSCRTPPLDSVSPITFHPLPAVTLPRIPKFDTGSSGCVCLYSPSTNVIDGSFINTFTPEAVPVVQVGVTL